MKRLYTSLDEIKGFNPCSSGWKAILLGQGKSKSDSTPFLLSEAITSNTVSDVCWLLGKRKKELEICVSFAAKCVKSVAHLRIDADDAAFLDAFYDAAFLDAADDAAAAQQAKNKQFLLDAISEYELNN